MFCNISLSLYMYRRLCNLGQDVVLYSSIMSNATNGFLISIGPICDNSDAVCVLLDESVVDFLEDDFLSVSFFSL